MTLELKKQRNSHPTWQQELATAFTEINELCRYLSMPVTELPVAWQAAEDFPLRVPRVYAARMEKGNPDDPLLQQVLPVNKELQVLPGYSKDPVGDLSAAMLPGLLHKYHGRALFISTASCAVNCRYCFRRNFPYAEQHVTRQRETLAIRHIINDSSINEIILSGGDPLLLSDARLTMLLQQLQDIAHVKRIRIHTRLPVVLPNRITPTLVRALQSAEKQLVIAIHANHGNEIDHTVAKACRLLQDGQVTLLNQSVLLKNINDDYRILSELSEKLFAVGVLPYYIHLLDRAQGTGHFEVDAQQAIQILQQVRNELPGYLVPRLVREEAGALAKIPL